MVGLDHDRFDVDGVRSCIESSQYSHGISRKKLYNALKGGIVPEKVDEILDWLSKEGYIFTTPWTTTMFLHMFPLSFLPPLLS